MTALLAAISCFKYCFTWAQPLDSARLGTPGHSPGALRLWGAQTGARAGAGPALAVVMTSRCTSATTVRELFKKQDLLPRGPKWYRHSGGHAARQVGERV